MSLVRMSVESVTKVYGPEGGAVYQVELIAALKQDAQAVAGHIGEELMFFGSPPADERHEKRAQMLRIVELSYLLGFDPDSFQFCDPRPEGVRNPKLPKKLLISLTVEDFDRVVMGGDGLLRRTNELQKGGESWVWFEALGVRFQTFDVPAETMDRWFHPEKYMGDVLAHGSGDES